MQSVSVFLDVTKFSDFQRKNADVSRAKGVRPVVYMFFAAPPPFPPPSMSSLEKVHPE